MVTDYSPIVISVYDRLDHLKQCVDSLKTDAVSRYSDLYIVSDAPYSKADEWKVNLVREYVSHIRGFRQVVPIERERNLGSFLSVTNAIDDVAEKHGTVIFLEDDNVVSPNFLSFINEGLAFYQDDLSIFSISGYNYPIRIPRSYKRDVYKWQGFSAWGVGLWYNRWKVIEWKYPEPHEIARGKPKRKGLDQVAEHLCGQMLYDIRNSRKTADTIISYHMYTKNLYSIFPVVSKVRNIGHDGTGEHGGITDLYLKQPMDCGGSYEFIKGISPDEDVNRVLRKHFRPPVKGKVVSALADLIPGNQKKWIKSHILLR